MALESFNISLKIKSLWDSNKWDLESTLDFDSKGLIVFAL